MHNRAQLEGNDSYVQLDNHESWCWICSCGCSLKTFKSQPMAKKLQTLLGQFGQITAQLREVLGMEPSQIVMDSAVLRFELAYEVMCKTLQAHATWQGKLVQSPR